MRTSSTRARRPTAPSHHHKSNPSAGATTSRARRNHDSYEGVRIGGGFHTYPHTIRQFPIRTIDFTNKSDKAAHDRMVKLVDRMLDLHKKLAAAKSPLDKERLPREIESTDRQID